MTTPVNQSAAYARYQLQWPVLLGITTIYWLYAGVSAVLYVYGLNESVMAVATERVFATWDARLLQYLLLLPALIGCYWLSLRIGWRPLWRRLPLQLLLGLGFTLLARPALLIATMLCDLDKLAAMFAEEALHGHASRFDMLRSYLLTSGLSTMADFLVRYGFGLALVTAAAIYKNYRDIEVHMQALQRQWSSARLSALRMQLSPHALFNLLHVIRGQISWDPPAAQRMVVQLGDMLRRLLRAGEQEFCRLQDEVEFARVYLALQQQRFVDRLTFELPTTEELPDAWVPSLILQPLIENAVTHGLAGHSGPNRVSLEAIAEGDRLQLRVCNDIAESPRISEERIGTSNTRERLAVHFGERGQLMSGASGDHRWCATIDMPMLRDLPGAS
ncbi:MAG: histidine kinase [Steroidobacteraceae bacterium]